MIREKPLNRLHLDFNLTGQHWLGLENTYSKYLCIYVTETTSTKATITVIGARLFSHTLVTHWPWAIPLYFQFKYVKIL